MHNPFDVWAPSNRGPTENLAFSSYAYNQQQIEDFIDELAAVDDPTNEWEQRRISYKIGINLDHLSRSEIEYIEEEVAKRHG